ncbi:MULTISPECIES: HAD family hydrolase [Nostoc]|uniref:HAD family hydrolase n=1 Tax=Nostoc paludosum FACHB-159 TaxID=2692908 RepID=A0ABR8K7A9_9NOSO|nr:MULTISPECIES: HAD family hydrolase [Nostoc]MBD2677774.1 HAD family hydrolase [Nostoc sp. FACHB-857]MBD2734052.1 HAD family hydrolase [Nostoc paludosum FACHB-159]
MKLVMFDIDGTLTESNNLDNESYLQALYEVFGFSEVSSDWTSYTHVTDACILNEIFQNKLDRIPLSKEVEAFQQRFLELLLDGTKARGGVKAISGSSDMLKNLLASGDYQVAYAGGGWTASAIFKLKSANLPIDNIPYAFSDDDESREGIMAIAHSRAEIYYDQLFSEVVYIGDGVWDIRSAKKSGYSFIGIACDNQAQALFNEGATDVFPNYDDYESFLLALKKATGITKGDTFS